MRESEGVFVAEGVRVVSEALASEAHVESLYFAAGSRALSGMAGIATLASEKGARVFDLAPGVMERVADTVTPQDVIAVVKKNEASLGSLKPATMVLVMAGVSDPGNAGTMLRMALGAGADAAVVCSGSVDPYNPKVIRSSAGAIFHLPVVADVSAPEVLSWAAEARLCVVGTAVRGARDYASLDWTRPFALFMGNEGHGVDADLVGHFDEVVSIPVSEQSESLNVAMAASVICFEAARQRRLAGIGS